MIISRFSRAQVFNGLFFFFFFLHFKIWTIFWEYSDSSISRRFQEILDFFNQPYISCYIQFYYFKHYGSNIICDKGMRLSFFVLCFSIFSSILTHIFHYFFCKKTTKHNLYLFLTKFELFSLNFHVISPYNIPKLYIILQFLLFAFYQHLHIYQR